MDTVSLIIPVYNEEKYIKKFVESIQNQDYDFEKIEIVFIDGNSIDNTKKLISDTLENTNINYKILDNPKKITPISLNIGIKESVNDIIIRLDAHSVYPENYISKCVYYLNKTGADNVGCTIKTESEGIVGNTIANVLSSKFGVGNSKFRTDAKSGYVDTVPFGTFRRELFEKIGYFDERLPRNQDSEFNSRIIKNGGKIYLFNDIQIVYYPRNTISKLIKMAMLNGRWNLFTNYLCPNSMKLRHFIPFVFVISLLVGILEMILLDNVVLNVLFLIELLMYFVLDIIFSLKDIRQEGIVKSILALAIYPIFHISYGIGTFGGIYLILKEKIRSRR